MGTPEPPPHPAMPLKKAKILLTSTIISIICDFLKIMQIKLSSRKIQKIRCHKNLLSHSISECSVSNYILFSQSNIKLLSSPL